MKDFGFKFFGDSSKVSIRKRCLKIRVQGIPFYVPIGEVEHFLMFALSSDNDIVLLHSENSDFSLD